MTNCVARNGMFKEFGDLISPPELNETDIAIGFIPERWEFQTRLIRLAPLPFYEERKACFQNLLRELGRRRIMYPPIGATYEEKKGRREKIPKTDCPRDLWPPPLSHALCIDELKKVVKDGEVDRVVPYHPSVLSDRLLTA